MKIGKNPAQLAKIQPQLDALGLTLEEATKGFRNQGQFIAALNAAKNHNLDFVALQEAMTVDGLSLGQAAKKVANTPPPAETPERCRRDGHRRHGYGLDRHRLDRYDAVAGGHS